MDFQYIEMMVSTTCQQFRHLNASYNIKRYAIGTVSINTRVLVEIKIQVNVTTLHNIGLTYSDLRFKILNSAKRIELYKLPIFDKTRKDVDVLDNFINMFFIIVINGDTHEKDLLTEIAKLKRTIRHLDLFIEKLCSDY